MLRYVEKIYDEKGKSSVVVVVVEIPHSAVGNR